MAIEWDIYLGTTGPTGKLSPFGRKVSIKDNEKSRDVRAAGGDLVKDVLYNKKEFTLQYANITESALDTLDYWYNQYQTTKAPLNLYMYTSASTYDEYLVIPRPVDRTRVVRGADNLFSGVKFTMVEA